MQNRLKIVLVFLVISVLYSCEERFKPDYTGGKAIAIMNGELWEGQGRGIFIAETGFVSFGFTVYNDLGYAREDFGFNRVPLGTGKYILGDRSSEENDSLLVVEAFYFTSESDGDVIGDVYKIIEEDEMSKIMVDVYDESSRMLTGAFTAKFVIHPNFPKGNPNNPDTIVFEGGVFEVYIEE